MAYRVRSITHELALTLSYRITNEHWNLVRLLAILFCTTTNDARWHHYIRFYISFFSCLSDGNICSSLRVGRNVFSTLLIREDIVLFVGKCSSFDVSFRDSVLA